MSAKGQADWKGCWAILWRSLVFLPYMLAVFVCVGTVWATRWVLPLVVVLLLYARDFLLALAAMVIWLLAIWVYRHFHLARFFEPPPSLL